METQHNIIIGDSREMKEIPDESVHLVITSPPYWQLKDYGNGNQIGFNDTYEQYINNLNLVWKECYRVLHQGCRLCVNIGDQFARSVYYGRYKVIPIRTEIIKFCEAVGFDYMGAIIWQKVTTCNTTGGATIMGSYPYPRNGIIKIDYEFILIFKKDGNPPKVSREIKDLSKLTQEEWNQYFNGHWNFSGEKQDKHLAMFPEELPRRLIKMFSFVGDVVLDPFLGSGTTSLAARNLARNSIGYEINEDFLSTIKAKIGIQENGIFPQTEFKITRQDNPPVDSHGLTPVALKRYCHIPWHSPPGLHPGSSVARVARGNPRSELLRAEGVAPLALPVEGATRAPLIDWQQKIMELPYIFTDPVKFDKRVDPKRLRFGSKVDDSGNHAREVYYVVKEILSPGLIVLNNGIKYRLLGVKEKKGADEEAIEFLLSKLKGEKVFLKYDSVKCDDDGNLLCYLYLQNKTFINAHLIKKKLADVDTSIDYKYRDRFMRLQR